MFCEGRSLLKGVTMNIRFLIKNILLRLGVALKNNRKSKALFYHDIYETVNYKAADADVCMGTHIDVFKTHVETIRKEGFEIVSRITKPEGQVCIMLDDGFRGIYECREFFYSHNVFPTIFLAVDLIAKEGFLTKEEILDLQQHGFNFECHSWSHCDLTIWSDEELKHELGDSKEWLSEMLGKEITEICLPIGYFNDNLLKQLQLYGYQNIYSSMPGNYDDFSHGLRRRNLVQYATAEEVALILRGGNELLKGRYEKMHHKS